MAPIPASIQLCTRHAHTLHRYPDTNTCCQVLKAAAEGVRLPTMVNAEESDYLLREHSRAPPGGQGGVGRGAPDKLMDVVGESREVTASLARTRELMRQEVRRMGGVVEVVEEDGQAITGTEEAHSAIGGALERADVLLRRLQRQEKMDRWSKRVSLAIFLLTVGFIVGRRVWVPDVVRHYEGVRDRAVVPLLKTIFGEKAGRVVRLEGVTEGMRGLEVVGTETQEEGRQGEDGEGRGKGGRVSEGAREKVERGEKEEGRREENGRELKREMGEEKEEKVEEEEEKEEEEEGNGGNLVEEPGEGKEEDGRAREETRGETGDTVDPEDQAGIGEAGHAQAGPQPGREADVNVRAPRREWSEEEDGEVRKEAAGQGCKERDGEEPLDYVLPLANVAEGKKGIGESIGWGAEGAQGARKTIDFEENTESERREEL